MVAVITVDPETQTSQIVEPQEVIPAVGMLPLSADRKAVFLNTLISTGGNISKASELIGMSRENVLRWSRTDPAFAELLRDALEAGTDNLEERYYYRAMDSSDRAAEFLLKARRPEKYREDYASSQVSVTIDTERGSLTIALQQALASESED